MRALLGPHHLPAAFVLLALLVSLGGAGATAEVLLDQATVGTGPYYLDQSGETYRLTEDVTTSGSGLVFAAEDVTLDLDGHRLTFGTAADTFRYGVAVPPPYPHVNPIWSESDITVWNPASGATITHGEIVQANPGGARGAAFIAYGQHRLTLNTLGITIYGDDTFAIQFNECSDIEVAHCEILDETTVITNRHAGRAAIDVMGAPNGALEIHDNTIHQCRQWGIRVKRRDPATTWAHVYANTIEPATIVTNGYGVGVQGDRIEVSGNVIDAANGRGIHIELCDEALVHDNDISVVEEPHWDEYSRVSAHGIKLEHCTGAEVYDNDVTSYGKAESADAVSNGAALVIGVEAGSNNYIHDNIFTARHLGGSAFNPSDYGQFATALEIVGVEAGSGLRIEANTFITEDRFFTSSLWHGPAHPDEPVDAGDLTVRGNRWQRQSTSVPTVKHDLFFMDSSVENLRFVDNEGGDFQDYGTGWPWLPCAWSVAYSGSVVTREEGGAPFPEIEVEVRDTEETLVASATTDGEGRAALTLDAYDVYTEGAGPAVSEITNLTPHAFTGLFPGGDVEESAAIEADAWEVALVPEPPALPPAPEAAFSGDPLSGDAPLTVQFTDLSTNEPTAWEWSFGDGGEADTQHPEHTFTTAGTFTVSLTAANAGGEDTVVHTGYITVTEPPEPPTPPVADFEAEPTAGEAPLTVQFTDRSTNEPTAWEWDFGDGSGAAAQNPEHTYDEPGSYTVALTVTNADGSDTETQIDLIVVAEPPEPPTPPVADFEAEPTQGEAPLTVQFTDRSTNEPTAWEWDFGDGSGAAEQNPEHIYDEPGSYTVALTVTNADGSDTETQIDLIVVAEPPEPPTPPVADFEAEPTQGEVPLTVQFTDRSTNEPTAWEWDFGDGSGAAVPNPEHTYDEPGSYTVALTVTNADGNDTETQIDLIVVVEPPPLPNPPDADFTATPVAGEAPLRVVFRDCSSNEPESWSWSFGDGAQSTEREPTHVYEQAGTYTVALTVTNADGSDTVERSAWILVIDPPTPPLADFRADPRAGQAPLHVTLTDMSSGEPTSWVWDFGDGNQSTLRHPTHIYEEPGTYTVALTARNEGGEALQAKTAYVVVHAAPDAAPLALAPRNVIGPAGSLVYSIPAAGDVQLDLFGADGRHLAVLADGRQSAGEHELPWGAHTYPSGAYFVRLRWDGEARTRKLLVLE